MPRETRVWLKAFLTEGEHLCCVTNVCAPQEKTREQKEGLDVCSCRDKSENPQEDPHGSHVGFSMLSQPWVLRGMPHPPQKGFSKNHTSELGEMSDYYLVQTYHFTDEICLLNLIPISHVALRLVSPGLSYRGWLELFCFVLFFKSGDMG